MEWANQDIAAVAAGLFIGVLFIGCVAVLAVWVQRLGEGAGTQRARAWPKIPPRAPRDITVSPLATKPFAYYTITTQVPIGAKPCPHCGHPMQTEKKED